MEYKLIYVEWCDAITNEKSWLSEEEAIEWAETENWINQHVGWVIKETDEYILVAGEKSKCLSGGSFGHVTKIPKTWIRRKKTLAI